VDVRPLFYHLHMRWETVWTVAKWVLVVIAAGFVGQFGKSLAIFLLERRRRRQANAASEGSVPSADPSAPSDSALKARSKIEKKRTKAEVKRVKKS
jgi:hypothetical protein